MKSEANYNLVASAATTTTTAASEANCFMPMAHALDLKVEAEEMLKKDNDNLNHRSGI